MVSRTCETAETKSILLNTEPLFTVDSSVHWWLRTWHKIVHAVSVRNWVPPKVFQILVWVHGKRYVHISAQWELFSGTVLEQQLWILPWKYLSLEFNFSALFSLKPVKDSIEVLHCSHVACQKEWICFALKGTFYFLRRKNVLFLQCNMAAVRCKTSKRTPYPLKTWTRECLQTNR